MADLLFPASKRTPSVMVDSANGLIEMRGISTPEDPSVIFKKLENAIKEYAQKPASKTTFNINLSSFNTSTSKWLLYILLRFRELAQIGNWDAEINWFYEKDDSDSFEAGEGFKKLLKFPINLVEVGAEE